MANGKPGRPRKNPLPQTEQVQPSPVRALEDLSLAELVDKAITLYRVPLTPAMMQDKDTVIEAIRRKTKDGRYKDFALDARQVPDNQIPPGFAKITLHKDPNPSSMQMPYPFGNGGYIVGIPRDIPVLVAIKIVDGPLNDAVETITAPDPTRPGKYKKVHRHVQPFQEHGRTEGPDPRPNNARLERHRPREEFARMYGYWPTTDQLKEAFKDGVIRAHIPVVKDMVED